MRKPKRLTLQDLQKGIDELISHTECSPDSTIRTMNVSYYEDWRAGELLPRERYLIEVILRIDDHSAVIRGDGRLID